MEKTPGYSCPRCGLNTLNVYYEDDSDQELGAICESCGLKGFFAGGKLMPLAIV